MNFRGYKVLKRQIQQWSPTPSIEMNESNSIWIDDVRDMKLLGIRSNTTLQPYRDSGKIRFTQPGRKVILYDSQSIMNFLDDQAEDI